jgi:serine O-acetyltransferase
MNMEENKNEIAIAFRAIREWLLASPHSRYATEFTEDGFLKTEGNIESMGRTLSLFKTDLLRWNWRTGISEDVFEKLVLAPNLLAVFFYRLSHELFKTRAAMTPDILAALARWMTGVEIYYSAEIGKGLKVIHGLGTVVGAGSKIGDFFTIYQGVTIGDRLGRESGLDKRPVIGDYVIASAGCTIMGPLRIGSRSIIGANAVVLQSLPGNCIAAGCPATIRKENISEEIFHEYWKSIKG